MIDEIMLIKQLIIDQGYSVAGAQKQLSAEENQTCCQQIMNEIVSIIQE